jgi:type III secretory pathway component EscS
MTVVKLNIRLIMTARRENLSNVLKADILNALTQVLQNAIVHSVILMVFVLCGILTLMWTSATAHSRTKKQKSKLPNKNVNFKE